MNQNGIVKIVVPGNPQPQKRTKARAFFNKKAGKWVAAVYDPKGKSGDYRARVAHEAAEVMRGNPPLEGPLEIEMLFYVQKPKSKPKKKIWPDVAPDFDNYSKACLDALEGIVFRNDAQICRATVEKKYAEGPPVTGILVRRL